MGLIKLIAIDIDGTIYPHKGQVVDLDKFKKFQKVNRKIIGETEATPIICTGKSYPYVERLVEDAGMVDVPLSKPMTNICEAGAVIFRYNNWEDREIIRLGDTFGKLFIKDRLRHIKEVIAQNSEFKGVIEEVGRLATLSFNPPKDEKVHTLYEKILRILKTHLDYKALTSEQSGTLNRTVEEISKRLPYQTEEEIKEWLLKTLDPFYDFSIWKSSTAVDILPFPTGKGLGISYIATKIHKTFPENAIAIGDTPGDHPAFDIVGIPIAVANATQQTKDYVKDLDGFVTRRESIDGVCDVLEHLLKYPTVEEFKKNWDN